AVPLRVERRRLRARGPDVQSEDDRGHGQRTTRRNACPVRLPERTPTRTRPVRAKAARNRATPFALVRARRTPARTRAPLTAGRTVIVIRVRLPALTRLGSSLTI